MNYLNCFAVLLVSFFIRWLFYQRWCIIVAVNWHKTSMSSNHTVHIREYIWCIFSALWTCFFNIFFTITDVFSWSSHNAVIHYRTAHACMTYSMMTYDSLNFSSDPVVPYYITDYRVNIPACIWQCLSWIQLFFLLGKRRLFLLSDDVCVEWLQISNADKSRLRRLGTEVLDEPLGEPADIWRRHFRNADGCWPDGVEHRKSWDDSGPCWRRSHRGREHCVPVLWHVEGNVCMAHGRHGSVQHQLSSRWRTEGVVLHSATAWSAVWEIGGRWFFCLFVGLSVVILFELAILVCIYPHRKLCYVFMLNSPVIRCAIDNYQHHHTISLHRLSFATPAFQLSATGLFQSLLPSSETSAGRMSCWLNHWLFLGNPWKLIPSPKLPAQWLHHFGH